MSDASETGTSETGAPEAVARNVQLAIEQFAELTDFDFGLDRASLKWVEGFVERQRERLDFDPNAVSGLVNVIGSFLGECIAVNADGRWRWSDEHGWAIRLTGDNLAFPFAKVQKLFANGLAGGDSIVSFYDVAVAYIATGGFPPKPTP